MIQNAGVEILLTRPAHLTQDAWDAIEAHRQRLSMAITAGDFALVIGSSKELVESVARAVIEAAGTAVVSSNADFETVVGHAHSALERQPGPDVSMSPEIRNIASSAKKIVSMVRELRNDYGTGHGRGRLERIDEEKATVVLDAAQLWCRWALRRLEHILVAAAPTLIAELRAGVLTRQRLRDQLEAIVLPDQPSAMQRTLGAAFAQRSMEGTFVVREAGVEPPAKTTDLVEWPTDFRLGLIEGFTLSSEGYLTVDQDWVPTMVAILAPVPPAQGSAFLQELSEKVASAGSLSRPVEELYAAARAMAMQGSDLPVEMVDSWRQLAREVDPTGEAL